MGDVLLCLCTMMWFTLLLTYFVRELSTVQNVSYLRVYSKPYLSWMAPTYHFIAAVDIELENETTARITHLDVNDEYTLTLANRYWGYMLSSASALNKEESNNMHDALLAYAQAFCHFHNATKLVVDVPTDLQFYHQHIERNGFKLNGNKIVPGWEESEKDL